MFRLFKRKKRKEAAAQVGWELLGAKVRIKQRQCADWLQGKISEWPSKKIAMLLLLFCLVMAACCSYILYKAFSE